MKKIWRRGLVRGEGGDFWSSFYDDVREALIEAAQLLAEVKDFLSKRGFLSSSWFDLSRYKRVVSFADELGVDAFDVIDVAEEVIDEEGL
jgi:hypothetical protein